MLVLRSGAVLSLLAVSLAACSSSNFETPATADALVDDTSTESGVTDGAPADGAPADAAVDPCAPEPGKAKYCVVVKLARPDHPPYNSASGAASLGLDGKGKVFVALFDKPIGVGPGAAPTPAAVLSYPSLPSAEISVDGDLPATIVGAAAPGEYSVVSLFQDNAARPTMGGKSTLPGDFVALPVVRERQLVYPKVNLTLGTTQTVTMELYPWRRVTLDIGVSSGLLTRAKTATSILGDGPMLMGLFDGGDVIGASTAWLTLDDAPCVDLNLQGIPSFKSVNFGTTVDGGHNVFVALFDYTSSDPEFPGRGSLMSRSTGGPYPRIEISKDTWTASAAVDLSDVAFLPQPAGTTDPLNCP